MAVPTYDPRGIVINDIRKQSTAAADSEAQMFNAISQEMGRVADRANNILNIQAKDFAIKKGRAEGGSDDFDPNNLPNSTMADRAYAQGAMESYSSRLEMDTKNTLFNIAADESLKDNIPLMQQKMDEFVKGSMKNMPADLHTNYRVLAETHIASHIRTASENKKERDKKRASDVMLASLFQLENDLTTFVPQTEEDLALDSLNVASYQSRIERAVEFGFISVEEGVKRQEEMLEKRLLNVAMDTINRSDNPTITAMNVVSGNTGNPELDSMDAASKLKILSGAQQVYNSQQQIENAQKKANEERRKGYFAGVKKSVYMDPYSPQTLSNVEGLMELAITDEEVEQAQKLLDFIEDSADERYNSDNPAVVAGFAYSQQRGELDQETLDQALGKYISISTYNTLSNAIEQDMKGIKNSPAFDAFVSTLDATFPSKKQNPLEVIMGMASNDPGETAQGQKNDALKRQVIAEAHQKIADGDLKNADDFNAWQVQRINEIKATNMTVEDQKPAEAPVVLAPQAVGDIVVSSDAEYESYIQDMYAKYDQDLDKIRSAARSGAIDRADAQALFNMYGRR